MPDWNYTSKGSKGKGKSDSKGKGKGKGDSKGDSKGKHVNGHKCSVMVRGSEALHRSLGL